jgi:hypothetical protein
MFLEVLLVIAGLSRLPPNFPELPTNYTEWENLPSTLYFPSAFMLKFPPPDSFSLPFIIHTPKYLQETDLWLDTTHNFGYVEYEGADAVESYTIHNTKKTHICIFWLPVSKANQDALLSGPRISLYNRPLVGEKKMDLQSVKDLLVFGLNSTPFLRFAKISLDKSSVEEVIINGWPGFRLRAFWWGTMCDGGVHNVRRVTSYFIPAKGDQCYDFIIYCSSLTYHRSPPFAPLEEYTQEEADSIRANWEYEKTYPNNIADLEQAVEQSFRVK